MSTPERCREQAQEAERLASVVSYERDRVRLMRQADEWRARAAELELGDAPEGAAPAARSQAERPRSLWGALLALFRPRGPGG